MLFARRTKPLARALTAIGLALIMSTDSLIVLPLDRGVPATTVELGVPCVDFDFDPDGGLVIATRNGIVSLDPPRPAIGER